MSESEAHKAGLELPSLEALEDAVRRALRQLEVWRRRAIASETERRRLQAQLEELGAGNGTDLAGEVERLREANERLRQRLADGLRQAEELAREVEFLEDTR